MCSTEEDRLEARSLILVLMSAMKSDQDVIETHSPVRKLHRSSNYSAFTDLMQVNRIKTFIYHIFYAVEYIYVISYNLLIIFLYDHV